MTNTTHREFVISDLEEIHAEGQYGASFRAVLAKEHVRSKEEGRVKQVDAVEGQTLECGKTYFIKCPEEKLDVDRQQEFVDREFESGSSINYAAQRIKNSVFGIVEMIGKGSLYNFSAKRGDTARPCLIYAYAGKSTLTRQTLASLRPVTHSWSSLQFLDFARAFARAVQVLHNQGIVHSFIVPRNIICVSGPPKFSEKDHFTLVGFGYARHSDAAARRTETDSADGGSLHDTEDQWYRAPECRLGQSHAPFGYTADLYSIGAILYSLLLDQGAEDGWDVLHHPLADTRLLKRRIFEVVEAKQKDLIWQNENILKIIDSCLRWRDEDRFSCVEELIEAIDIARAVDPYADKGKAKVTKPSGSESEEKFVSLISNLNVVDGEASTSKIHPTYFLQLRRSLAESVAGSYAGLGRGHFEVYGHRDRIVTSLCRLLGSVREGSYQTMTLPDYWTDANLGSLGRFLTMNKHMARCGVKIQRLFLVSDEFHKLGEQEQIVLEEQLRALEHLERQDGERPLAVDKAANNFELRVQVERREEKIADFERNGELVAFLAPVKENLEETICLNFFSTARETRTNGRVGVRRIIRKVRYWNPAAVMRGKQFKKSRDRFKSDWDDAVSLRTFVLGKPEAAGRRKPKKPGDIKLQDLVGPEPQERRGDGRESNAQPSSTSSGNYQGDGDVDSSETKTSLTTAPSITRDRPPNRPHR